MSKLPSREKRRRKGYSAKENGNVSADKDADNSRYDDQSVATNQQKSADNVGEKSRQYLGEKNKNNGHFSKMQSSRSLSGKPSKNRRSSFGSNGERSNHQNSGGGQIAEAGDANKTWKNSGSVSGNVKGDFQGGHKGTNIGNGNARGKNKTHQAGTENKMRNMRAPVQPTPAASFVNEQEVISNANFVKPHTAKQHNNQPNPNGRRKGHFKKHNAQRLYAALDLGTNNCRLLIAIPQEKGRFRVIDGFSKIVRLGEGLAHSGKLSDEAMDRAVDALKICAMKLGNHDVRLKRLIATEACRQATNGDEFLKRVRLETGLKLEVINRETEARLAAEGCGALIDKKADAGVLFDIGGGSSELILVNRRQGSRSGRKRISDQIVAWTSLPVGVVTLAERYGGKTVTREVFKAMVTEVRQMLEEFPGRNELARIWKNGRVHLLGTSGTVTTLAGIHLKLTRYDRRLVDGLWMTDKEIDVVLESLLGMNYQQRAASPCIGRERADLVMAGCAILEAIRITWPARRLRVADRGLREGILTQLMDRDGAWVKPKKGRWPRNRDNANRGNANRQNKNASQNREQRGPNE